jgi:hypothetical protein
MDVPQPQVGGGQCLRMNQTTAARAITNRTKRAISTALLVCDEHDVDEHGDYRAYDAQEPHRNRHRVFLLSVCCDHAGDDPADDQ